MSVADDLFAAIETGDVDAFKGVYAPSGTTTTRSSTGHPEPRGPGVDGRHSIEPTKLDGTKVEVPACIVASVAHGKITRIDEYLDGAHVARITG